MKLIITSASGNILSADRFESVTLMTESGEITILTGHAPLISAIRPGIMRVAYYVGGKVHTAEYATGGGVLHISIHDTTIVADIVEHADHIQDLEYIEFQKKEAARMAREYREEHGAAVDPKRLIEIEYELLRYTAMHHLGKKYHASEGSRK